MKERPGATPRVLQLGKEEKRTKKAYRMYRDSDIEAVLLPATPLRRVREHVHDDLRK